MVLPTHQREIVEALAREYPPQDKVISFKHAGANVVAVVAAQLIGGAQPPSWEPQEHGMTSTAASFPQYETKV
jgi:hypothetical protein